jgi:hypothetical protein
MDDLLAPRVQQAVFGFIFGYHPNNIDQLSAQVEQGLRFGFAFGYFFEIRSYRIVAQPRHLGQGHPVKGAVQPFFTASRLSPTNRFFG